MHRKSQVNGRNLPSFVSTHSVVLQMKFPIFTPIWGPNGFFYSRAAASLMMVWVGIVVKTFVSLVHHAFWNSRLALLFRRLSHWSILASLTLNFRIKGCHGTFFGDFIMFFEFLFEN